MFNDTIQPASPNAKRAGSLLIHRLIAGLLNAQLQLARRGQQLLMGQSPSGWR